MNKTTNNKRKPKSFLCLGRTEEFGQRRAIGFGQSHLSSSKSDRPQLGKRDRPRQLE